MKDQDFSIHMLENYQNINETEDGISFAKEGFTQLYDTFLPILKKNKEMEDVGGKHFKGGLIVGSVVTGLAIGGIMYLKKKLTEPMIRISCEDED